MGEKLEKALMEYEEMFDDGFPTIPLAFGRTDEEVIGMIENCIVNKKDVYDMGILTLDNDILY